MTLIILGIVFLCVLCASAFIVWRRYSWLCDPTPDDNEYRWEMDEQDRLNRARSKQGG